ncbi:hypothetical protein M3J09_011196 [Ascochyta lentis]
MFAIIEASTSSAERPTTPLQTPTKKKSEYVWQCCVCGYPCITYRSGSCPKCGHSRCDNGCNITKIPSS